MVSSSREITGARTAHRVLQLLRLVAQHNSQGLTVKDIVERSGLDRSTAHRLVMSLESERFIERDASRRRFFLGVEAVHMASATSRHSPLVQQYRFTLQKVARLTGNTTFLIVRQGDFGICFYREEGELPPRTFKVRPGDVRPLGVGVSGLAMLAQLPDAEVKRIYRAHVPAFEEARLPWPVLWTAVQRTRRNHFSELSDTVTQGVTGIGRALMFRGEPVAAVSLLGVGARMTKARRKELGQLLDEIVQDVAG